jgi:glycine betaine/proline transport system permease protein
MTIPAIFGLPQLPLAKWVNSATQWLLTHATGLFHVISSVLGSINSAISGALHGIPEAALFAIVLLLAWEFIGFTGVVGAFVALGLISNLGLWSPTLDTLALTLTATLFSLAIALPVGIWAGLRERRESLVKPIVDFMQTMPPYVYLIPSVMFFSVGAVPAIISTIIFASAPPIRMTTLGIRQVPADKVEVSVAFGATQWQILRKVQLPLALPSILVGVNQCIMMSLSMVIIASMIGANGLGQNIINAITQVQVGAGFVAGLAVVLLAIVLDRITHGVGRRFTRRHGEARTWQLPLSILLRRGWQLMNGRRVGNDRTPTRTAGSGGAASNDARLRVPSGLRDNGEAPGTITLRDVKH